MKKIIWSLFLCFSLTSLSVNDDFLRNLYKKYEGTGNTVMRHAETGELVLVNLEGEIVEIIKEPTDYRPERLKQLEEQVAKERNPIRLPNLMKTYNREMNKYLNSIEGDEELIFRLGNQYFTERQYEKAAQIFSKNIDSARNIFGAATSYRFLGEYQKAIDFYSVAIDMDSTIFESFLGRGLAYKNLSEYDKAIKDIREYMNFSKNLEGYLALADIYIAQDKRYSARTTLQSAKNLYPNVPIIETLLKSTYSK